MNIFKRTIRQLRGQVCWDVHHDRLLNLSMNFGDPWLKIREPYQTKSRLKLLRQYAASRSVFARGRWWLWIYYSYWKISYKGKRIATGSSSIGQILQATGNLSGQKLMQLELNVHTGNTRFTFDLGSTLDVRRRNRNDDEILWILHKPKGYILSVQGNGTYDQGAGTKKRPSVRRHLRELIRQEDTGTDTILFGIPEFRGNRGR